MHSTPALGIAKTSVSLNWGEDTAQEGETSCQTQPHNPTGPYCFCPGLQGQDGFQEEKLPAERLVRGGPHEAGLPGPGGQELCQGLGLSKHRPSMGMFLNRDPLFQASSSGAATGNT